MALPGLTPDRDSRGSVAPSEFTCCRRSLGLRPELDTTPLAVRAVNRQL